MTHNDPYIVDNEAPGERKTYIRNLFDTIVPTYDLLNRMLSGGVDTLWRRNIFKHIGSLLGKPVIDLCCGTGDLSRILSEKGARVASLDFSMNMLLKGRERGAIQGDILQADASRMPLRDESFSAATIAFGIRNIPDLDHFIQEVFRVLRPGGYFVILELVRPKDPFIRFFYNIYLERLLPLVGGMVSGQFSAYHYLAKTINTFLSPEELQRLLEQYGFVRIRRFPQTFGVATIIVCQK